MRTLVVTMIAAIGAIVAIPGRADAYPQFQLAYDQTCTGCHIAPSGGTLLNENGLAAAESISQLGQPPEFFYGKVPTPSWLTLGGDLRGSAGYMRTPEDVLTMFPMQADIYGSARFGAFTIQATAGYRPPQEGNEAATSIWSREFWAMWQSKPGETSGAYVRVGRFMPVFGLRLAEHSAYERRFGGTPLYSEALAAAAAFVDPRWEVHVTGFLKDRIFDPVSHQSGAAGYGELRVTPTTAVGAEGMFSRSGDDKWVRAGLVAKQYLAGPRLLLQAELQFANQLIHRTTTNPDGGAPKQLLGYVMGSLMLTDFVMLDVALGYFNSNLRIADIDRDGVDINLHYFLTSHVELAWNSRIETFGFGGGGPTGAYSLLQLHYRL